MRARDTTLDPLEQPSLGIWVHVPSNGANTFAILYYSDAVPDRTDGCSTLQSLGKHSLGIVYSPSISSSHGERCCRRLGPGLHETLMHPPPKGSISCAETAAVCAAQPTCPSSRLLCLQFQPHRQSTWPTCIKWMPQWCDEFLLTTVRRHMASQEPLLAISVGSSSVSHIR